MALRNRELHARNDDDAVNMQKFACSFWPPGGQISKLLLCCNTINLKYWLLYWLLGLHYITLHKIVFRVPKITRTARTLYEIKEVIWEYSYEGKHLGMLSAMLITVNLLPYQHFSPSDYLYMGTLINELLGLPCVLCFSVDPIGLRSGLQMSLWPGTVIPQ